MAGRSSSANGCAGISRRISACETRVARYHNVYGPHGTYDGGREKAPAAICRKVVEAKLSGDHEIEIWGDGEQTRSFMFIDDCVYGTQTPDGKRCRGASQCGERASVTINELVSIVEGIAGVKLQRHYNLDAPQGVSGRNSDNTLIKQRLGWEPEVSLEEGLEKTYGWIYDQMTSRRGSTDKPPSSEVVFGSEASV